MLKSTSDEKIIHSYHFTLQVNRRLHYFLHTTCLLWEEYSSYTSHMQRYTFLGKKVLLTYEDLEDLRGREREEETIKTA